MPTPDASGQYRHPTFAQAQRLASFHLARPDWLPPCLGLAGITASVPNITETQPHLPVAGPTSTPDIPATPPAGPVRVVRLGFIFTGSIAESLGPYVSTAFTIVINELKQGTPLGAISGQDIPGHQTISLTIARHSVTRITWATGQPAPGTSPNAVYTWTDQGTTFQLIALLASPPVVEPNVEHMIASMLQ